MIKAVYTTALLGTVFLCACGNGELKPSEFKKHIENEENGFVHTVQAGDFNIRCLQAPSAYLAVLSFRSNDIPADEFEKRKNGYDKFDSYKLEITAADPRNLAPLSEYFSFYMQEQVTKVCGNDTLPCIIYHGEPFNSVDKRQHIEIGFEKTVCDQGYSLCFKGTPMSQEPILIPFENKALPIPAINLQ